MHLLSRPIKKLIVLFGLRCDKKPFFVLFLYYIWNAFEGWQRKKTVPRNIDQDKLVSCQRDPVNNLILLEHTDNQL